MLEAYHAVYQGVIKNNSNVAILYRLRDLAEIREKLAVSIFRNNKHVEEKIVPDLSDAIFQLFKQNPITEAAMQQAFSEFVNHDESLRNFFASLPADSQSYLYISFQKYCQNEITYMQKFRQEFLHDLSDIIQDLNRLGKMNLKNEQKNQLQIALFNLYREGLDTKTSDIRITELLENYGFQQTSANRKEFDNYTKDLAVGFQQYHDREAIQIFTRAGQFSQNIMNEHPDVTHFFNIDNKSFHQLVDEGIVYCPRVIEHVRDLNMIWMLATMQQNRMYILCSEVSENSKYRQNSAVQPNTVPSAFCSEIAAASLQGYQVAVVSAGVLALVPAEKNLADITLEDIEHNMKDERVRKKVCTQYDIVQNSIKVVRENTSVTHPTTHPAKTQPDTALQQTSSSTSTTPAVSTPSGSLQQTKQASLPLSQIARQAQPSQASPGLSQAEFIMARSTILDSQRSIQKEEQAPLQQLSNPKAHSNS